MAQHDSSARPRTGARSAAQQNAVSFPFSAEQVVRMGRAPWARTALEDDDDIAVATAMSVTEVDALAHRKVSSLSGGERARVALAHADRVTLLAFGRVAASGSPAEVLTAERIELVYGQPVDVFPHPITGVPLVVPKR